MFEHLPSLRGFQPQFYTGGPSRFYLPLLYDLVATCLPRRVVILGWDSDVHFTLCQVVCELGLKTDVISIRECGENHASDDEEWQAGAARSDEFYRDVSRLIDLTTDASLAEFQDESVELFVVHDFVSLESARLQFEAWKPKLSNSAIAVVHGVDADRAGGPRELWEIIRSRHAAELHLGNGVGITTGVEAPRSSLRAAIFGGDSACVGLAQLYAVVVERIDAAARAETTERENRLLRLRQIWQPTLLDDRVRMQETIDHLNRHIEHLTRVHDWEA
ncbi:MAG: class I SAM-dependent methyltransferase, partial [Verrucomicrobiota bacterium]|nr:class I SAM-dependent methyltransferase [Verrucomicrobiota bacterium]